MNEPNGKQVTRFTQAQEIDRLSFASTTKSATTMLHHLNNKPRRRRQDGFASKWAIIIFIVLTSVVYLSCSNNCYLLTNALPANGNQIILIDPTAASNNNSQQQTTMSTNLRLQLQQNIQASFSTPNQAINITHVTYDPLYDTVYLGATNAIYQLNGSDLSTQYEQTTGPVFDNPSCGITDCQGFEDFMKPTQNVNKILVIDYQHRKLLSCGSTKQGACRRYQLNNIGQKEDLISMAVAANDDNSSTYAFIAPARYSYDPSTSSNNNNLQSQQQQQVLYVASTFTKVGSRDLLVPAIGTRILDDGPNLLKLYENSLDSARVDINSHLRDYFLVNYLYGFASSNYIYFVTVQKKATSRDYEELGYHTRLARICITDSSYNSYTEVDLKCLPNKRKSPSSKQHSAGLFGGSANQQQQQEVPSEYPLLQDAILVDAGSQLLQSLAQNDHSSPAGMFFNGQASGTPDDGKVLLGVFSSARDHTQHAGEHSAICAFSLSQIEDKFNDNIHNCYTGKMQSRNMEYIAGNVQECPKSGQGGNVVNFCHETLKINGTIPIVSEASIQFYNTTLTAITATSHVNSNAKNIYSDHLATEAPSSISSSLSNSTTSQATKQQPSNLVSSANQQSNQHTVVFVGTSNGHLKKVLLNNASAALEFDDVQLDTNPILSDLHLHSSGQQLIVATPYKVMKVPTHNCGQYTSCRECSHSRNPYCGWCSLKRSCTTKNECVSPSAGSEATQSTTNRVSIISSIETQTNRGNQLKWISNDSAGKCIDLQSIVPDKIPITSTGKVDLYIDRLPRLPKEHSYKCIFDRKEQTTASMMPFGLSCPLPKVMHRPKIQPGRDHAIVDLAVRSSETNTDFLDGKITFFECQLHTTCKDCLTTNWGCNWCLNENICLFNATKCDKTTAVGQPNSQQSLVQLGGKSGASTTTSSPPIVTISNGASQRSSLASLTTLSSSGLSGGSLSSLIATGGQRSLPASNTIGQVNQCPTFDVGHKQDILVADGSEKELAIKVKNMPQFKGNIQCIVEIENDKITLKAKIEEDRVICESSTYTYTADVGLLTGQLVVIYSDNNIFIDRTNFTMYKCHLLGAYLGRPDCSLCQRIDSRFQCAWCSASCQHKSRCQERPEDTCPPPRIDYVYPLTGPMLGGTRVTIEGSNLGQSFSDIENRVTIGNQPCKPIEDEYRPSNKIVCITSAVAKATRIDNATGKFAIESNQKYMEYSRPKALLGDVMVGNKAGYSMGARKFQFESVHLNDHEPKFGPQSGGTRITLSGWNLNVGSNIQVFLDELPCQLEPTSMTSEQIVCKTSASQQSPRKINQLRVIIDDAVIVRTDDPFFYYPDPNINRISPLKSYLSGGRPIVVTGSYLTSVMAPRIAILDAAGKIINETTCIHHGATQMQCPSPAVNLQMMDLEWNEQQISGPYEPTQPFSSQSGSIPSSVAEVESVKFRLSFIMDNVARLRDLQTNLPNVNSEISYTNDPKLYPFASQQYKTAQKQSSLINRNDQLNMEALEMFQVEPNSYLLLPDEPSLVLHGEHLAATVSEYELTVTVGRELCNLTHLSNTKVICTVASDHLATPTDEEGHQTARSLPLVVARIGFNLRYELGYLQYHPALAHQIGQQSSLSRSSGRLPVAAYSEYVPREKSSFWRQSLDNMNSTWFRLLALGSLVFLAWFLVAERRFMGPIRWFKSAYLHDSGDYKHMQASVDLLEKSVRNECRIAALAVASDLHELVRHVELTGTPLLKLKNYVIKVFFPGINNHPLLIKSGPQEIIGANETLMHQQQAGQIAHSIPQLKTNEQQFPGMEYFEQLVLTKPFLVTFVNTLEQQPGFTIRDKVNVASLIMIILMERLDYATDILRTLLFQLVERSVQDCAINGYDYLTTATGKNSNKSGLSGRASNLLGGLPISKRGQSRAANLSKVVGGSASSLMASTHMAAQMLLSRVGGNKTSPLQPQPYQDYDHYMIAAPNTCSTLGVSTTAFNQRNGNLVSSNTIGAGRHHLHHKRAPRSSSASNSSSLSRRGQSHLMLRRTDSVVEKMLTNWLALNMYDYFHGPAGNSLYMMVEALKCQLERGPVDSVTGDAYYSLNEAKLLREAHLKFEMVNLYVIVSTDIIQGARNVNCRLNGNNLLIDAMNQPIYGLNDESTLHRNVSHYSMNNANSTITVSLRVLDCDTISQVKAKILSAIYKNVPYTSRLSGNEVELSLRQQQQAGNNNQFVVVTLSDEDYSSVTTFDGMRKINTLSHYGVTDQAILMLNRSRQMDQTSNARNLMNNSTTRTTLTDMLEDHYNNLYSEIQYGPINRFNDNNVNKQQQQQSISPPTSNRAATAHSKAWHLIKTADDNLVSDGCNSNDLSPSSNSPSMMLLANENHNKHNKTRQPHPIVANHHHNHHQQQQQYYLPSSSSTSSSGNVMDTNSTSANSSSINVTSTMMAPRAANRATEQQPIYCQIGSVSGRSQLGANGSNFYCQIGTDANQQMKRQKQQLDFEQENKIYLSRMLASKGTIQSYIDDFFKSILGGARMDDSMMLCDETSRFINAGLCEDSNTRRRSQGVCPPAVKWLFDLLDEAAKENGVSNQNVVHSWKSNAFLLRFWMNFIKNPNYILDVEKTETLDSSLSSIAQTLMDSCTTNDLKLNNKESTNKLVFAKDVAKYRGLVKKFYQDIASMKPVSDQEMVERMGSLSMANAGKFDTNWALKELHVYAFNYGVELMNALNSDYTCQQLNLSQQLDQCFRSITLL